MRSPAAPRSQPRFRPGPPSRLRVPPTWRQRWGHVVPGLAFPAATLEPGKWAERVVVTSRGGGASSGRWRRRAMGAEEPDVYRDTWVRYLGELRHRDRGWRGEPGSDRDSGHSVPTPPPALTASARFRVPAPGVGSAAPRAPQLWAAPCPRCCPPEPFVRALPAAPPLAPRCPSAGTKVTPGVGVTPPP